MGYGLQVYLKPCMVIAMPAKLHENNPIPIPTHLGFRNTKMSADARHHCYNALLQCQDSPMPIIEIGDTAMLIPALCYAGMLIKQSGIGFYTTIGLSRWDLKV